MTAVIEGFALSPQQTRLWKLHGRGLAADFRAVCVLRPSIPLDAEALGVALQEVVRRNEILRTDFRLIPGMELPLQVIGESPDFSLRQAAGEEIEDLVREMAGPGEGILRAVLADLPDGQRLLLSVPALCADLPGLANLAGELERCYGGLPQEEPVQYADVASWMAELLENRDAVARKYWQEHGVPPLPAALPFEKPREAEGFDPQRIELDLPAELARGLGAPPAAVLLTAWCLLLQRLTRQRSLVIGAAFDGRRHEELRGALGLFARHLPVAFAGEGTFAEEVRKAAGSLAELAEWQELFEGPRGDAFFPFCFEFFSHEEIGLFAVERCQSVFDRFDLKLVCRETPAGLRAELFHAAGALRREDAVRVGEWFVALLRDALGRPGAAVDDLEMLTPADRERWSLLNATDFDFGPARTLAERFEEQVDRTPENLALAFRDRTLTYRELDQAANRLARHLRALGVGPDREVALCVERSPEMVIGMLGILKAGGAYVPVDPAYPEARRAFMLEDVKAVVALTEADLRDPAIESLPAERLPALASPDNLAYVIYTSGSTGQPKGVMISHRAISNRLLWQQHAFPLTADDRVLQKTPYSFDASVWEVFLPLLTGACLVVAEP
ncbi:MAG TPA: AMP-binding protein, partial [Thermoanaerobaculia bacterium]|nr:AMP-binding protein [Thermoanaerobaculia bacterium]